MPICKGCEQKVPYQELDIHQRYCEGRRDPATGGGSTDLNARADAIEEYMELAEERLRDRLLPDDEDRTLPDSYVGIERSNAHGRDSRRRRKQKAARR